MKLSSSATWYAVTAVLVALILGAAWMLAISPKLDEGAQARADTENVQHQNQILRTRIAALKAQAEDLDTVLANMVDVHRHMPVSDDAPTLIRTVWDAAGETNVFLADLTLGVPEAMGAQAPERAVVPEDDPNAQTAANLEGQQPAPDPNTPVPAGEEAPADPPEAAEPAPGPAEETEPVDYITGLYGIPVTIIGYGNHTEIEAFLARLQDFERFFLPYNVVIETEKEAEVSPPLPAMEMGDAKVTVTGYIFVLLPADSIEYEWPAPPTGDLPTPAEVPAGEEARNPYIGLGRTPEDALGPGAILPEDGEDGEGAEGNQGLDIESEVDPEEGQEE